MASPVSFQMIHYLPQKDAAPKSPPIDRQAPSSSGTDDDNSASSVKMIFLSHYDISSLETIAESENRDMLSPGIQGRTAPIAVRLSASAAL
jgi:hypothetical protein